MSWWRRKPKPIPLYCFQTDVLRIKDGKLQQWWYIEQTTSPIIHGFTLENIKLYNLPGEWRDIEVVD